MNLTKLNSYIKLNETMKNANTPNPANNVHYKTCKTDPKQQVFVKILCMFYFHHKSTETAVQLTVKTHIICCSNLQLCLKGQKNSIQMLYYIVDNKWGVTGSAQFSSPVSHRAESW